LLEPSEPPELPLPLEEPDEASEVPPFEGPLSWPPDPDPEPEEPLDVPLFRWPPELVELEGVGEPEPLPLPLPVPDGLGLTPLELPLLLGPGCPPEPLPENPPSLFALPLAQWEPNTETTNNTTYKRMDTEASM
jgi:hypothetical protein